MSQSAVQINSISKSYKEVKALEEISMEINQGELFGIIGPDGAGKTTLFRILTTLLLPDKGSATINGLDVQTKYKDVRRHIGYMPGRFSLYQDLTVEENLKFFASVFGTTVEANYELVKDIYQQIEPFKTRRAGDLSGGMKQKLALSCALIHKPSVIILDEPTTGVDAVSRKEFWHMLEKLKQSGITILVSTPYMDEADMCDRVALLQHGKIMGIDTPKAITASFSKPLLGIQSKKTYALIQALRKYENANSVFAFGQSIHYTDKRSIDPTTDIKSYLNDQGFSDASVMQIPPTIEDVFMERMQQNSHGV